VRFAAFTPETNPAAVSHDGQRRLRLERLRLENGLARATVELEPALVEFTSMTVGDSLAMAGAAVSVAFTVANRGGTRAVGLRVRLLTEDPLVEILDPEIVLADLGVGQTSLGPTVSPQGYPRFRFFAGLQEAHRAVLGLELYDAEGVLLDWSEVTVAGIPSCLVSGIVRDPAGQILAGIPVVISGAQGASGTSVPSDQVAETVRTDSSGRYELRVPLGAYYIAARPVQESPWIGEQNLASVSVWSDTTIDFTLTRAYRLRGHVYDPDGNLVRLVSLQLTTLDGASSTWSWTGGDGGYDVKVPAGRYQLITGNVGPYPAQVVAEIQVEADQTLDLHLQRGTRLALRVTGEEGEPVPGQSFYLQPLDGQLGSTVRSVISGPEGVGEAGVVPGRYAISPNITPAPYLPPASFQVEVNGDTTVTVVLARGVRVAGCLVDESGNELPSGVGGNLSFSSVAGGGWNSYSLGAGKILGDGDPHFSLGLAPGQYRVYVSFSYWPLRTPSPPSQGLGTVEVRSDTTFDLVVRPGITVRGRLLDEAGRIMVTSAAPLQFESIGSQNNASTITVLSGGSYELAVVPGEYRVRLYQTVTESGALPQQVLGTFTAIRDTTVDWIARTGERLVGRIVDTAGQGISGLYILAQALDSATYGSSSLGSDGSFALALFPGRYRLQASQVTGRPSLTWNLGEFEVPAIAPIERSLPSGATLQVQVRDAAGQPVSARLALVRDPREWHGINPGNALITAYLDGDGRIEIPVAPGRYALAAYGYDAYSGTSSSLGRVLTDLEVQGSLPVEVVLPSPEATVRLSGQVRDRRDGSPATAGLQFCDEDQGIAAMVSSQDGTYQVDLPPGTYGLTAALSRDTGPAEIFTYGPVEIRADSTWDILLGPGGTAVRDDAEVVPRAFALGRSYPNPFNGQALIPYALPVSGPVSLIVYNLAGQVVRRLVSEEQEAGTHLAAWDGRDEQGRGAASGVYLCRMKAGVFQQVQRLALVR
ncbi:MAG: FlgD immunoglobulin-like domain containing protein, partial [Candidatus Latescibacterota bacterium]|jgi:hypothetical protein